MISVIINTASESPVAGNNSPAGTPYGYRAHILRNFILPSYRRYREVLVCGGWTREAMGSYRVIDVPPVTSNILDVLYQRQAGLIHATGDILVFQSDDHIVFDDLNLVEPLMRALDADVLVPSRWTRIRGIPEPLNDGRREGYAPFHCAAYRRRVLDECPWTVADGEPISLDVRHSNAMKLAGFRIVWTDELQAYDIEPRGNGCL